jgi:hypothetical protein
MDEKKIINHIDGHEFVLQDQIRQAAELIQGLKDFVGEAIKAPQKPPWPGLAFVSFFQSLQTQAP